MFETLLPPTKISATPPYQPRLFNPSSHRQPGSTPPSTLPSPTSHQPISFLLHPHYPCLFLPPPNHLPPSPTPHPQLSSARSSLPTEHNPSPPPRLLPLLRRVALNPHAHAQETNYQHLSRTLRLEQDVFRRRSTRTRPATDLDLTTFPSRRSLLGRL